MAITFEIDRARTEANPLGSKQRPLEALGTSVTAAWADATLRVHDPVPRYVPRIQRGQRVPDLTCVARQACSRRHVAVCRNAPAGDAADRLVDARAAGHG